MLRSYQCVFKSICQNFLLLQISVFAAIPKGNCLAMGKLNFFVCDRFAVVKEIFEWTLILERNFWIDTMYPGHLRYFDNFF